MAHRPVETVARAPQRMFLGLRFPGGHPKREHYLGPTVIPRWRNTHSDTKTLARQHTSVRRKHVSRKQFPNSFRSKLQSPHEAAIHSALSGSPFTSPNVFGSVNSCARASRAVIASCEEWFCKHLIACATLLRVVCLVRPCTCRRSRCVR